MYIPIICLVFLNLVVILYVKSKFDFREGVIKAVLLLSSILVLSTEFLSHFNQVNILSVRILWVLILFLTLIITYIVLRKENKVNEQIKEELCKVKNIFFNYKLFSFDSIFGILLIVLLVTLFIEAFSITNNYDSYTYHLPKIENWIKNGNVNFYPTNNLRQIYIVPLSEYIILNIKLLSNSNVFNNFVQYFSYIFSGVLVSLIVRVFNGDRKQQIYGLIFALTVPMAIFQSVTTQTDLLISLCLLSFIYFSFKIIGNKEFSLSDFIFASVSVSLGIFAKSTFYVFALPFGIILAFYILKNLKWKVIKYIPITIGILLLINFPFLLRNYQLFGSLLGPVSSSTYYIESTNSIISFKIMISNFIKNMALHFALPNEIYNGWIYKIVSKVHKIFGLTLNDSNSNFFSIPFGVSFQVQHDAISNFIHAILIIYSSLVYIFRKKVREKLLNIYLICCILSYFIFALVLKWQPWQTRLDLPFFLMFIPFFVMVIKKKVLLVVSLILLISGLSFLYYFDLSKAIFSSKSFIGTTDSTYIINYKYALEAKTKLDEYKINNVGFIFGGDFPEWGYWIVLDKYKKEYVAYNSVFKTLRDNNGIFTYKALLIDDNMIIKQNIKDFISQNEKIEEIVNYDNNTTLVILKIEQDEIFFVD
jgi:hypothetical protein